MAKKLKNSVVVITGASSGIGRATALAFAKQRARLVLAARNEENLSETAEKCKGRHTEVLVVPTDVSQEEEVENLARRAVQARGLAEFEDKSRAARDSARGQWRR